VTKSEERRAQRCTVGQLRSAFIVARLPDESHQLRQLIVSLSSCLVILGLSFIRRPLISTVK
jgi:hypothetical protein